MTTFVADSQLNMSNFLQHVDLNALFSNGDVIINTLTEYQIKDPTTQEVLTLTGVFGGYDVNGNPTSGTITGGSYVPGSTGFGAFTFSDASLGVPDFISFIRRTMSSDSCRRSSKVQTPSPSPAARSLTYCSASTVTMY